MNADDQIQLAKARIELAKQIHKEYQHGTRDYEVLRLHGYVVIDDGQDRWLATEDDYDQAIDNCVESILDGTYDDIDDDEIVCNVYSEICGNANCIFSRIGMPSDISAVHDLDLDPTEIDEIIDALGMTEEEPA